MTSFTRTYSPSQVKRFAKATGDLNPLHDPKYMAGYRRHPLVHGMLLFTDATRTVNKELLMDPARIEVFLAIPVSPGERVEVGHVLNGTGLELCVNHEGTNLLSTKNQTSKIVPGDSSLPITTNRVLMLASDYERFKRFRGLLHTDTEIASLLYAMARGSAAIYRCAMSAENEEERKVQEGVNRGVLPVFSSLKFQTTGNLDLDPRKDLEFRVGVRSGKTWRFSVQCYQGGKEVYSASHCAFPFPKAEILKMAKPL